MAELQPRMRAGDADRTKVVEALGRHLGEGRLTVEEFDERTAHAHAAVYLDQLPPLLADLPGDPAPVPRPMRPPARPHPFLVLLVVLLLVTTVAAATHGVVLLFPFVLLFLFLRHGRRSRRW